MKDIAIIGAGPIGCYAGYWLAKAGNNVTIYENHSQIGSPIQCTGLLTSDFDEFNLPKESFLVNTFSKIEVYSPNGEKTTIKQKEYLVCRIKFDNFFADLARKEGAHIYCNHPFLRRENGSLIIKDTVKKQEKTVTPDSVIAADGPLSPTAKAYGFYHPERINYYGLQATVQGKFDPTTYSTYFGEQVCPGLFAWIVPESETIARVGIGTTKNARYYFDQFLQHHGFIPVEMQAGPIPVYHPEQELQQGNCYVVGDAATYVKATTLGGLVPGLKQAQILADCIIQGKEYLQQVKSVKRRMWLHLKLRRILDKFSDKDWNKLVHYINQPKIRAILEQHTRENPLPIVLKSLLQEPRFFYFMKHLW